MSSASLKQMPFLSRRHVLPLCSFILLISLSFLAFFPALSAGFVWDDDTHLQMNLIFQEHGFYHAWLTFEADSYWPVTWTSYWLEHLLWGFNPSGYHFTNILLHALNALLLWRVLKRLNIPGACLTALIFAVHPVNVESVVWISQRKNLLSMLFFLLAWLGFLGSRKGRCEPNSTTSSDSSASAAASSSKYVALSPDRVGLRPRFWLALLAFLLGMLSKGAIAPLPMVLLLSVWWLDGRVQRADFLRTLPFFAVALIMSVVEVWVQLHRAIQDEVIWEASSVERLLSAARSVGFYLSKVVLPIDLCFVYPRWTVDSANWREWLPLTVVVAASTLFLYFRRSWGRPLLFAGAYFILMLLPVLGFVDFYFLKYSLVGDHYLYYALAGVIAVPAGAVSSWISKQGKAGKCAAAVLFLVVLLVLGRASWQRSVCFRNEEILWLDTLSKNRGSWMVFNNLGVIRSSQGRREEASFLFREAVRLEPDSSMLHNNLGTELARSGEIEAAIEHLRRALELDPGNAEAAENLAVLEGADPRY